MSRPNRRNYYRILHVQPDAPGAVIRMAYRTLMQKLRAHPDLGGDGATASLINEAYAVLSDAEKRAAYDAQFGRRTARAATGASPTANPRLLIANVLPAAPTAAVATCPFCTARLPAPTRLQARCAGCASPLAAPPPARRLSATRRAFERQVVAARAEYFLPGDSAPRPATLRDFSPRGAQLSTADAVASDCVIALKTHLFDALARVVHCEPASDTDDGWLLRLEFLTLALLAPAGSLVSTRA
jgi:curved DNA-binding protein CbpA